ncbi:MAG TPA: hypothetical protein VHV09_05760 [Trebonia sp.]|jgi:hypothetical protein|nr:hypothetical protein [Trebonia sp.]
MIVRSWSATADATGAADYQSYFGGTLLPELRKLPGFSGAYLLRRDLGESGPVELTAHTLWDSPEAIRAFAGEDITASVVEPEAQAMLLDFDRAATHRSVVIGASPLTVVLLRRAGSAISRLQQPAVSRATLVEPPVPLAPAWRAARPG